LKEEETLSQETKIEVPDKVTTVIDERLLI
jgi:hypothetical protein